MSNETFAAKEGEVEVADSFVSLNWPHWSVLSERFKLSELPISMLAPTTDSGESKELADLAFPMALVAGSSMVRGIVKLPFLGLQSRQRVVLLRIPYDRTDDNHPPIFDRLAQNSTEKCADVVFSQLLNGR